MALVELTEVQQKDLKNVEKIQAAFAEVELKQKNLVKEIDRLVEICDSYDIITKKVKEERDEFKDILTSIMEKCDLPITSEQKYDEIAAILGKTKNEPLQSETTKTNN